MEEHFQLAVEIPDTKSEGPGNRYAIWVQGCHFNCPGCCNQEYLPFSGGKTTLVSDLLGRVLKSKEDNGIEGVSILGGEPFTQIQPLSLFVKKVQELGLSVMIYTGYRLSELEGLGVEDILKNVDLLVDGRYNQKLPDLKRRWIGSSNQKLHFLSEKYSPSDPCFSAAETVEFRLRDGVVLINGWPDKRLGDMNV